MRKEVLIFGLVLIFFVLLVFTGVRAQDLTGLATTGGVGFNITVTGSPTLTIENPRNETYFNNNSMLFKASSNGDSLWFNFDHGANTTLTEQGNSNNFIDYFNISEGSHTVYVFANNSDGITADNVNFTVDSNIWNISFSNFQGANSGASTNFNLYSFNELQNLTNITFEHMAYGKIFFNGTVNVTNISNFYTNFTDFDNNVNISSNRIELNSSELLGFDQAATLELYNLSFTNPRILKDGSVCVSSKCVQNSYSSDGNLSFNVTGFTVYSAEETPVSPSPGGSTGGGGGGGSSSSEVSPVEFTVNPDKISLNLDKGTTQRFNLEIKNTVSKELDFEIEIVNFKEIVKTNIETFNLEAGESVNIAFDILGIEELRSGVYISKVIIRSGNSEKEVLFAINLREKESLFDILVEIPNKYKSISAGDDVHANIRLFEVARVGQVDITLEYKILDRDRNVLISDKETLAIDGQANFFKSLNVPLNTPEDDYLFYVELIHRDEIVTASEWFYVESNLLRYSGFVLVAVAGILAIVSLILVIISFIILKKHRALHKRKK